MFGRWCSSSFGAGNGMSKPVTRPTGAASEWKQRCWIRATSSEATDAKPCGSATTTARPVLATEAVIVSSSSGFTVRRSTTSTESPSSAAAWAAAILVRNVLSVLQVAREPGMTSWSRPLATACLLAGLLVAYGSAVVRVDESTFRAGRASIAGHHLGRVDELDAEATRLLAGRDADARAYLLLRPYRKRAVHVEVLDPRDPTPYWLVSTRHPERLAAALRALVARSSHG